MTIPSNADASVTTPTFIVGTLYGSQFYSSYLFKSRFVISSQTLDTAYEIELMTRFKESYRDFPDGDLIKKDPPATDFVLTKVDGNTIGIELTEALHNEQARQISTETYNFTNGVLEQLKSRLSFAFTIDIDLDITKPISKSSRLKIISEVVEQCVKEFGDLQANELREVENIEIDLSQISTDRTNVLTMLIQKGFRNLPAGIQRIKIARVDSDDSWNWRGEGGVVPNFEIEDLNSILEKKHQKLTTYEYCDQYWLIITEGNYFTGTFKKISITTAIKSRFDKVFVFRSAENIVIELK